MKLKGIELEGTYTIIYYDTIFLVYDEKGNVIYLEDDNDYWSKSEYDRRGNRIYFEDSYGYWFKSDYDEKDNEIYFEANNGYWIKWEYDEKGNRSYYENSNGYWEKWKYNELGNVIYFENSNGEIIGERVKDGERVKELTIEEIEELLGYKIKIKGDYHGG